jgi:hypothetical protein
MGVNLHEYPMIAHTASILGGIRSGGSCRRFGLGPVLAGSGTTWRHFRTFAHVCINERSVRLGGWRLTLRDASRIAAGQAEGTEHKAGTHQKSLHPIVSDLSQLRCEAKLIGQWLLSSIDPRTVF